MTQIKTAIEKLAGVHRKDNVQIFDTTVNSVDIDKRRCVVTMVGGQSANTLTVRLMASVDDGCLFVPAVDSTVVVTYSDYVEPYISQYSEIDSIIWLGGQYDGVPIVVHPTDHTKGLLAKITQLENKFNALLTACQSQVVTLAPSGTFPLASFFTTPTPITPTTQQADIEHPNITH